MYVARRALGGPEQSGLLTMEDEQVVLSTRGPVAVDALEFEERAAAALASDDPDLLGVARGLYTGRLLPELV
jgi:DNA-binding SARP family transcriptional activator